MRKTFKYKAIPLDNTEQNAYQWLIFCKELYNSALTHKHFGWLDRKYFSCYDQQKQLIEIKTAFPEFRIVYSQVLQDVLQRLDKAYQNFFQRVKNGNKKKGFPRYKKFYHSFTYPQATTSCWKLSGNLLTLSKLGIFKLRYHRPLQGIVKTITVKLSIVGDWYICFSCDQVPSKSFLSSDKRVGIDMGLKFFAVDSNGKYWDNPRKLRNRERYIKRLQRSLSRKQKGGKNREKVRIKLAKIYENVVNQRLDFAHKFANHYVENYGYIAVEKLNIKGMIQNKYLSKSISDAAWNMTLQILAVKAENAGRIFETKSPNGTTIKCSNCDTSVPKTLTMRTHACYVCGCIIDRDLNAAINIRNKPARTMSIGHNAAVVMARAQESQDL